MFVLDASPESVESIAFGPDSRALAVSCAERGLLLWGDPLEGGEPRVLGSPLTSDSCPVRFSPDGHWIEWREGPTLSVFNATSGERVAFIQPPVAGQINFTAALLPGGASLLTSRMVTSAPRFLTQFERMPLSDPRPEAAWSFTLEGVIWDDPLFLPDGRTSLLLVLRHRRAGSRRSGSQWQAVLVGRELATGRELWASLPSEEHARSPTLSADGHLVAGWASTYLTVWRTDDLRQPPVRIKNEGRKHFTGIAFHPSGKYLAATSNDATVKLYDTSTWKVAQSFAWKTGRARCVAFSPDGCRGAVGSDRGQVLLWDVDV